MQLYSFFDESTNEVNFFTANETNNTNTKSIDLNSNTILLLLVLFFQIIILWKV